MTWQPWCECTASKIMAFFIEFLQISMTFVNGWAIRMIRV